MMSVIGLIGAILALAAFDIHLAEADNYNPSVYGLDTKPFGSSYGQWSANYWNWLSSIPNENNPVGDETGKYCNVAQKGPVWFLLGTSGGKMERTCTVPEGKGVFLVLLDAECSNIEFPKLRTEAEFLQCARQLNEGASVFASVDGMALDSLEKYRVESPLFNMTLPSDNILGQEPGNATAKAEGWYLVLEPLSPGAHEIRFGGSVLGNPSTGTESYATDVTYHLDVSG
jgi:hypothetical protein